MWPRALVLFCALCALHLVSLVADRWQATHELAETPAAPVAPPQRLLEREHAPAFSTAALMLQSLAHARDVSRCAAGRLSVPGVPVPGTGGWVWESGQSVSSGARAPAGTSQAAAACSAHACTSRTRLPR